MKQLLSTIREYWQRLERLEDCKISWTKQRFNPKRRRSVGRPWERWTSEQEHLCNPWKDDDRVSRGNCIRQGSFNYTDSDQYLLDTPYCEAVVNLCMCVCCQQCTTASYQYTRTVYLPSYYTLLLSWPITIIFILWYTLFIQALK